MEFLSWCALVTIVLVVLILIVKATFEVYVAEITIGLVLAGLIFIIISVIFSSKDEKNAGKNKKKDTKS